MRLKAKQNDEPNVQNKCRKDGVKTRNQAKITGNIRKLSVQTSIEKSIKKSKSVQNIEPNRQINKQKQFRPIQKLVIMQPTRKPHDPAENYYSEILNHTYKMNQNKQKFQQKLQLSANYLKIRYVLIQTMYKNFCRFKLRRKTMFLFVRFLDTFVLKNGYQSENILTQCYACFLMALKYQQIYPPSLSDWIPQTMHEKIYQEQGKVLKVLNFNLIYDSVQYYFQYYSLELYKKQFTKTKIQNCQLILDLLLFLPHVIKSYKPQKIALAIVMIELRLSDNDQNININQKQLKFKQLSDVKKTISKQMYQNYHRIEWILQQRQKMRKS